MKKMTQNKPIFEQDKQKNYLEGEVRPEDARIKAAFFAGKEKSLLKRPVNKPA